MGYVLLLPRNESETMKQTDIIEGQQYIIDTEDVVEIPYPVRQAANHGYITVPVVAKGVEYNDGRKDGATIDISHLTQEKPTVTISARKVVKSLVQMQAEVAEQQAEHERREEIGRAKHEAVAAMVDTDGLASVIKHLSYRPADAAIDLINSLDRLVSVAQEMRERLVDTVERGDDRWHAMPKRSDDGVQHLDTTIAHSISSLGSGYTRVVEGLAAYQAQATLVNTLTNAGVDFDRVNEILHPENH